MLFKEGEVPLTQKRCKISLFIMLLAVLPPAPARASEEEPVFAERRNAMIVETIQARGVSDPVVLAVMKKVERHLFVDPALKESAYADRPLPIGYGQTISQPYIVALMTELLQLDKSDTVLEVGTGSGYQAAVLGEIAKEVHTVEIIPELGNLARERLEQLGYKNVQVKVGDGYFGWQDHAPYDGIIVTAAATHIPPPLIEQLKPGGRMIIPVGPVFYVQTLILVEKREDGSIRQKSLMPVQFVPLTGGK